MTAAGLALAASVAWGIADFLGGLRSRRLAVLVVMALSQPIGIAGLGLVVAIAARKPPAGVLWAAPAALLGTLGIAAFYRGMALGSISLVAPVAATGAVIPVAVGIASGDDPSPLRLVGFVLAIGGAGLASWERHSVAQRTLATGVGWGVVAAIGFGGFFVPMHAASGDDVLWAAFVFRLTVAVLVGVALVVVRPPFRADRSDVAAGCVIGGLDTAANGFYAGSASLGLVSVVSVLASLYPAVTVVLAWAYLRERLDRVQLAGVAGALGGVVLTSAG